MAKIVKDNAFCKNAHHYNNANNVPGKGHCLKDSYWDMVVKSKRGQKKYHNRFVTSLTLTP